MAGNVINGAPNIISGPSFGAPQFLRDPYQQQQQAYEPQPQAPSFIQQLAQGFGGELGEGIHSGVKNELRKSLVNKALQSLPQNGNPEQMYQALLQVDPETRQELLPLIELRQQAQQRQNQMQQIQAQNSANELALGIKPKTAGQPTQSQNAQQATNKDFTDEEEVQQLNEVLRTVTDPKEKQQIIKNYKERKSEQKAERNFALKETKPFVDSVTKSYKTTLDTERSLDKMEYLVNKKTLSKPALVKGIKFFGLPLSVLGNPDNEEYEKESEKLVSGVNDAFRGQLRVVEIENFKNRIPTLMNSDEGKKRIIEGMREVLKANEAQYKITQRIIAENRGVPPLDIEQRVNAEVIPLLEDSARKFREIMGTEGNASKKVTVKNPTTGESFQIDQADVAAAQAEGYQI